MNRRRSDRIKAAFASAFILAAIVGALGAPQSMVFLVAALAGVPMFIWWKRIP